LAVVVAEQPKVSLSLATRIDQLLRDKNGPRIKAKSRYDENVSRRFVKMVFPTRAELSIAPKHVWLPTQLSSLTSHDGRLRRSVFPTIP
jgi:hypothetical protein